MIAAQSFCPGSVDNAFPFFNFPKDWYTPVSLSKCRVPDGFATVGYNRSLHSSGYNETISCNNAIPVFTGSKRCVSVRESSKP